MPILSKLIYSLDAIPVIIPTDFLNCNLILNAYDNTNDGVQPSPPKKNKKRVEEEKLWTTYTTRYLDLL